MTVFVSIPIKIKIQIRMYSTRKKNQMPRTTSIFNHKRIKQLWNNNKCPKFFEPKICKIQFLTNSYEKVNHFHVILLLLLLFGLRFIYYEKQNITKKKHVVHHYAIFSMRVRIYKWWWLALNWRIGSCQTDGSEQNK